MVEVSHMSTATIFEDAEADEIDALQTELNSSHLMGGANAIRRQELENRLSEMRVRRTRRISSETWTMLESLVGHKLRR